MFSKDDSEDESKNELEARKEAQKYNHSTVESDRIERNWRVFWSPIRKRITLRMSITFCITPLHHSEII